MKIASIVHGRFHACDLARDIVCRAASALGKGVGTGNSALPDLGGEEEGVYQLAVGQPAKLAELIGRASAEPEIFRSRSKRAQKRSQEFTWEKFRAAIKDAVGFRVCGKA